MTSLFVTSVICAISARQLTCLRERRNEVIFFLVLLPPPDLRKRKSACSALRHSPLLQQPGIWEPKLAVQSLSSRCAYLQDARIGGNGLSHVAHVASVELILEPSHWMHMCHANRVSAVKAELLFFSHLIVSSMRPGDPSSTRSMLEERVGDE